MRYRSTSTSKTNTDSIGIDPDFSLAYALLAAIHAENGNTEDAHQAAEQLLRADPLFSSYRYTESRPFQDPQLTARMRTAMQAAGLPD